jgi:CspA family cold shock protein
MARVTGTTKFFNSDKGYGFLLPADGGPDVFVHLKDLKANGIRTLQEDQRVSFEIVPGRDGKPKAANVQIER